MSLSSIPLSSLSVPTLDSLRHSSSSSSGSTSQSGSLIWDSCASDSQAETDITPPPSPSKEAIDSVLEASLQTLITLKVNGDAGVAPDETPLQFINGWHTSRDDNTNDHGDAGYDAEEEHDTPGRPKSSALPPKSQSRARRHKRRTPVMDEESPIPSWGVYSDARDIPIRKRRADRRRNFCHSLGAAPPPTNSLVYAPSRRKACVGLGLGLPSERHLPAISETDVLPANAPRLPFSACATPEELPTDYLQPLQECPSPVAPPPPSPKLEPQDIIYIPSPVETLPPLLLVLDTVSRGRSLIRGIRRPAARWVPKRKVRISLSVRGQPLVSPILEEEEDAAYA
ncbi:hypothetical protein GLOTRDRAFT_127635 [Gloeophyllum trabeum ATCC 11539]|uniref:Uncharacterized protein n=1 Tax=Gloeophyllum trabeum (strain ATCC 11539 / FP-39264 / Madison 617) TaxID=670483 RepID=S7RRK3_GLOTA|nr:uncharacterized protein GLOTRDRAFT_127635 [Gloeophyllum trabeum ATCC 11539]EPQ57275.1 hypothetical protein GLOTRDRAFT_127635 [Gloeophyllum trabeum ATCC 11539]